jgi:hypothetical protein
MLRVQMPAAFNASRSMLRVQSFAFNASRSNACGVQCFAFKCLRRSMLRVQSFAFNASRSNACGV